MTDLKIKLTQNGNYEWCWQAVYTILTKRGNEVITYGPRSKFFLTRESALEDAKERVAAESYLRKQSVVLKEEEIEI